MHSAKILESDEIGSDLIVNENRSRDQDIVRKGIERLEKQISQYTRIQISRGQIDIALLKKCKTTDIPAVNLAIENIQRALQ